MMFLNGIALAEVGKRHWSKGTGDDAWAYGARNVSILGSRNLDMMHR